jgi:hypothetical protein
MDKPVEGLFAIDAEARELIILNIAMIFRLAEETEGENDHDQIGTNCQDIYSEIDGLLRVLAITMNEFEKARKDIM